MNSQKTILLVEDDEDDQILFMIALKSITNAKLFDVANNGKEALEKLRKSEVLPTMIIMDINMPVMDGIECLSQITKDPRINSVPVVILSSSIEGRQRVRELGATAFIIKQNSTISLQEELKHILESE
ncbi:MAG: response regulator [Chryseolinea sp.]